MIIGGDGTDTLQFSGRFSDHEIAGRLAGGHVVHDLRPDGDETDQTNGVETDAIIDGRLDIATVTFTPTDPDVIV